MKRAAAFALVAVFGVAAAGLAVAARSQTPPPPDVVVDKVEICHAPPGSRRQDVSVSSIFGDNGHDNHDDDIIPPFRYEGGTYPGKNWNLEGQATWYFDCRPTAVPDVTPLLECVESRQDGLHAHFGYRSSESAPVNIQVGLVNAFAPQPENRGQPVTFEPGTHGIPPIPFSGALAWRLAGKSATASAASRRCQASLRIDKALRPESDPGRFDLLLNGQALATGVGNGGTTNTQNVPAAPAGTQYTVGERAAAGTNLADYATTIVCRDNAGSGDPPVAQGSGTSLTLALRPGQAVVCVISNVRGDPPGPGEADLTIVKTASPRSLLVGEQVTWTVTVTNKGPQTATNVVVEDTLPDDVSFVEGSLDVPAGVTCTGAVCRLATLAPGASVTGRFTTTVTAVGTKTNTVTADADQRDPNPADNAASAQVVVTGRVEEDVHPILECVDRLSDGTYRAHFGYLNAGNAAVAVPVGPRNAFTPEPADRGQPRRFQPGRAADVFQVDFRRSLVWTLTGRTSAASPDAKRCPPISGTLRIDKILVPADDPGRFNLEIDGVPAGTGKGVGHLGTTGDVAVTAGRHRVGEEGVQGTSLADFDTTIVCRGNRGRGAPRSVFSGPELVVDVAGGEEVVCTIENTRRSGPPVPPIPTPPGPTPPPTPEPGTSDLSVQKFVSARTAARGDVVTWTVVVTNNGPETATGVVTTDQAAAGATFVSLQLSQGTCDRTRVRCALGTIPPGGSVRGVAQTRMLRVGARLNTITVRGNEPDSIPENNVASALVRVYAAFVPPLQQRCDSLTVDRRLALTGMTVPVRAAVRNVFGRPLAGTAVHARGGGQRTTARTDARGVALLTLAPTTAGIVRFTVGARALTAAGARRCTARLGVVSRGGIEPGVTG